MPLIGNPTAATLTLLASLLFAARPAIASSIHVPAKNFSIEIRGKYQLRWAKIFRDGATWACQTQNMPYVEAREDPLKDLDWGRIAAEAERAEPDCRDRVLVEDKRSPREKRIETCLDLPAAHQWVMTVARRCGGF